MRVSIIGGGAMGEAIVAALLRAGIVPPDQICVAERVSQRRDELATVHKVAVVAAAGEALVADHFILAVKPQEFDKLAAEVTGRLAPAATAVSIMAGIPIARISAALRHQAVVRSIPNTPAQVGEGMTVWTASPEVSEAARSEVAQIFESLGSQAFVPEERYLDMATAVSGSGPGFVLLLIEAMVDAAVHIGLPRDLATEMAVQTFSGSARLARQTGRHPAELRNTVTSPGGTTAEGLRVLEAAGVRAAMIDAIVAAYNRSKELGGEKVQQ